MDRKQRIARLTGVQIIAIGSYAPPDIVTNADLAAHGYDADWIVQRTGILERRKAANNIAASDLAFEATQRCLKSAAASHSPPTKPSSRSRTILACEKRSLYE